MKLLLTMIAMAIALPSYAVPPSEFVCPEGAYRCGRNATVPANGMREVCFHVTENGIYAEANEMMAPIEFSFKNSPNWRQCIGVLLGPCTHETVSITDSKIEAYSYTTSFERTWEDTFTFDLKTMQAVRTSRTLQTRERYDIPFLQDRYVCEKVGPKNNQCYPELQ